MIKRFVIFIFTALVLIESVGIASAAEGKVVLVMNANAGALQLNRGEVRQLFLGGEVTKDGVRIVAVINDTDPLLYEIFLQKTVFMSAHTYERHLISKVLHKGGKRIQFASKMASFEKSLVASAGWVSFMWEEDARRVSGISVIGELWSGSVD